MAKRSGPSHDQFMVACNTEASRLLRGKRIVEVRYLTAEECRQLTWSFACVALVLDDGTTVYPAKDGEGNEAGRCTAPPAKASRSCCRRSSAVRRTDRPQAILEPQTAKSFQRSYASVKTTLFLQIEFDPDRTDPDSLATAMDRLLETACSTPGILDEYGNPKIGEFWVTSAGSTRDTAKRIIQELLDCPGLNLDELEPTTQEAIRRGREFLAAEMPHQTGSEEHLGEQMAPRYVLYDFDAGDLASTAVYTDYREAANDAEQLDNVLVVPLRVPATSP